MKEQINFNNLCTIFWVCLCKFGAILFQMEVMEEAAKYIEKLQTNLIGHIRTHGYPEKLKTSGGVNNSGQTDDRDSIRRTVDNYVCRTMMK